MKLSIVTCTLNSEKYLEESIRSVREQHYPDIEYLFVDGGSTQGDCISHRSKFVPG